VYFSVTGFKKKTVVFLTIAALGGSALIVCSIQSSANGIASERATSKSNQSQLGIGTENSRLFENDSDFSGTEGYPLDKGKFFFRAMLAFLFVVALGVAAVYVSKKLLPQIAKLPGKEIHIIETVHLGPRKALHLLEIGNRRFLIGSTNENVTKLADITDDFVHVSTQEVSCD
jgi:flagellar biosynthetic protein FliO